MKNLKKYNFVFLPLSKSENFIAIANLFDDIANGYKLSTESLPHLTLCQFHAEEKDIGEIWLTIQAALPSTSMKLEFKDYSCMTFDKIVNWVSLMPNRRRELAKIHRIFKEIMKVSVTKKYDPHLTLISTNYAGYEEKAKLLKSILPISDTFIFAIGKCDVVGQFTKIICC